MARRSPNLVILLSAALALLVVADVVRRAVGAREGPPPGPAGAARAETSLAAGVVPDTAAERAARWAAVRARIATEGEGTYLAAMLEGDSMLRRWPDERLGRPVRVALVPGGPGYRDEFAGTVAWALARWNGAQPVRLEAAADTAAAQVVVVWVERLEAGRTGTTELAWDGAGRIRHARITLGTHTPEGEPLGIRQMTALVLHELGHAIGLNHSPDSLDALFPRTRAIELTERDRRTGRLLYALPPGRFR